MKYREKNIIALILITKIWIFLLIILSYYLLPFAKHYYRANFIYPPNEPITLKSAFKTWDGQHYTYLSEQGYVRGAVSNAFPPLFPSLIAALSILIKDSVLAGLFVSNMLSFIAFYIFYLLVKQLYNRTIAYYSLLFLLAFPTSFYFSLVYSESLFFVLTVISFYFLYQKKYFFVSLIALFIPLSRSIGVFMSIPFLTYYFFEHHALSLRNTIDEIIKKAIKPTIFLFLSPLLGMGIYFSYMYLATGNALEVFHAASFFVSRHSFFYLLEPIAFFRVLFSGPFSIHGFTTSVIDRMFFLGFLFSLYIIYKKTTPSFFTYALVMGLIYIISGTFMSYTRHLLIIFPLFIAFAIILEKEKYIALRFFLLYGMITLQTLFLIMHSLNYWVA